MTQAEISKKYREAEIRGASSVDCVLMLYDIVIADVHKGVECIAGNDIEGRTNALTHCLQVLEQLQCTLQMESGGEAARHLYGFYSLARAKVLEAQLKTNARLLEEIDDAFQRVREMWVEVRRNCQPEAAAPKFIPPQEESASSAVWSA